MDYEIIDLSGDDVVVHGSMPARGMTGPTMGMGMGMGRAMGMGMGMGRAMGMAMGMGMTTMGMTAMGMGMTTPRMRG